MRLAAVEKALTAFVHTTDGITLALKGPWGRGKTFYWDRFMRAQAAASPTQGYAYVSLFGLTSVAEMKRAVAVNARALGTLADEHARTYLEEALASKWWSRPTPAISPFKTLQGGSAAGSPIVEDLLQREVSDLIVCIDDLERRGNGLRLADVLGYCSHLKERRGCRVVVILNEEAFTAEEAEAYRGLSEKVFDHQVLFDPSPRECTAIAIPETDERYAPLRESCERLRITNIRILQRAKRLVADFAPFMKRHDAALARRFAHSAALYTLCFYSREAAQPPYAFVKGYRDAGVARLGGTHEATPEEERWEAFLTTYGFRGGDPLDREIVKYIESGVVDGTALRFLLDETERELESEKRFRRFETAWEKLFESFDEQDADRLADVEVTLQAAGELVDISFVNAFATLCRGVGQTEVATRVIDGWIAAVQAKRTIALDLTVRKDRDEIRDPELLAALTAARESVRDPRGLEEVLTALESADGWGEPDVEVLLSASAEQYERLFRATRGERLGRWVGLCMRFASVEGPEAEVGRRAQAALRSIASDGPLNAWRVRRYLRS
ncbi:MAG: hypothetical protein K8S21_08990 [Gemmatimonadetes bacterium]|nr:hypothetical protein [Gemmatimonadota bacterium]